MAKNEDDAPIFLFSFSFFSFLFLLRNAKIFKRLIRQFMRVHSNCSSDRKTGEKGRRIEVSVFGGQKATDWRVASGDLPDLSTLASNSPYRYEYKPQTRPSMRAAARLP